MLTTFSLQLDAIFYAVAKNIWWVLLGVALLWVIQVTNLLLGYRLNRWGIIPRRAIGLPGIFFSPFLHGDFGHLFFNTMPLFVLANLVLINGWPIFIAASLIIIVLGGLMVWLFGRYAIHIGASGLVMGYWGYLLVSAVRHFSVLTVILAGICLYYFASMVVNLFPTGKRSSWEGHVFGFLAGVVAVYLVG